MGAKSEHPAGNGLTGIARPMAAVLTLFLATGVAGHIPQAWQRAVRRFDTPDRVVFLTFDDGPDPRYTQQVIDILDAEGVPGTFFLIGEKVEADAGRTDYSGHTVGYHTYSHERQMPKSPRQQIADFERGAATYPKAYPVGSGFYRAPRREAHPATIEWADERGTYLLWDVVYEKEIRLPGAPSDGSPPRVKPADERVRAVADAVRPGSVILMHDGTGYGAYLVTDLRGIIRELKSRGYRFASPEEYLDPSPRQVAAAGADELTPGEPGARPHDSPGQPQRPWLPGGYEHGWPPLSTTRY